MATRSQNLVNPDAEIVAAAQCLQLNVAAARGLQAVLKTNLGPKGTLKMLVGGAGQIKITKDGSVLLYEMQIQHPTAMMIARAATAMDDQVGDGTTSTVLLTGELLKQAEQFTSEGLHPRLITEGYEAAKDMAVDYLDNCRIMQPDIFKDREVIASVAKTSLSTKLADDIADNVTEAVVNAMMCIAEEDIPIDLHMIEIMQMEHKSGAESCFVDGIVMDHGSRHPDMPKQLKNVHVLTCNVSMEYEKTEITAGFYYSSAEEREKLVESERKFTDEKVMQLINFKRSVCKEGESFAVVNQKGIDPVSLDMLAKEGIFALRRAKRRNMERLTLAFGGVAVNSFDDLQADMLGWAGELHEEGLGDDKFTFVQHAKNSKSCTILIRGPNKHTIDQIKDATRDGLRAVKAALEDKCLIAGAGAFEIGAYRMLMRRKHAVSGKAKLGVEAYARALLCIPKVLAENSGLDVQDSVIKVEEEQEREDEQNGKGHLIGMNLENGEPFYPVSEGVYDSYIVKRQSLHLATVLATQLLLVDEVMKAGKAMGGKPAAEDMEE